MRYPSSSMMRGGRTAECDGPRRRAARDLLNTQWLAAEQGVGAIG
jgi:hypothetical protein